MSRESLIYQAKKKLTALAEEFIVKDTYGYSTDCIKSKIMYLKTLITTVERYVHGYTTNSISGNILQLQGQKIILSQKNNYICNSEDKTIDVTDTYLNCITEEELCKTVNKIKAIIHQ